MFYIWFGYLQHDVHICGISFCGEKPGQTIMACFLFIRFAIEHCISCYGDVLEDEGEDENEGKSSL